MLVAKDINGTLVNSIEGNRQVTYYCPCCKGEVILKKGSVKLPHFAHKNKIDCIGDSENETQEHIQGKMLIAKNCEKFGVFYELECYLPEINQRADVLINKQIAIEFQCSSLSIEKLKERTMQYQTHGYQVFWILGENLALKERLCELQKHFIYYSPKRGYYDLFLSVKDNTITFRHYFGYLSNHLEKRECRLSLEEYPLLTLLSDYYLRSAVEISQSMGEVNRHKQVIAKKLATQNKAIMLLQEQFYRRGEHVLYLPFWVYLPNVYHPLLNHRDLLIRFIIFKEVCLGDGKNYDELKTNVNENIPSDWCIDYANTGAQQIVDYSLSLYLSLLQKVGMLRYKNNKFYSNYKKKVMKEEQIEKLFKNSRECLTLPLKYDMIIK